MKCSSRIGRGTGGAGICLTPVVSPGPLLWLLCALLWLAPLTARSQPAPPPADAGSLERQARFALSQNLADYLFLGTLNAELQYSIHRSWTLLGGARYNNWTWRHRQDSQFESRQQTYYLGVRWWPWYTYSGWWLGTRMQYQEYNRGGIFSPETEEGDAFGVGLSGGYSVHVNRWLNVNFGIGGWGGLTRYVSYACPYCGKRTGEGTKAFFLPNELLVALELIF